MLAIVRLAQTRLFSWLCPVCEANLCIAPPTMDLDRHAMQTNPNKTRSKPARRSLGYFIFKLLVRILLTRSAFNLQHNCHWSKGGPYFRSMASRCSIVGPEDAHNIADIDTTGPQARVQHRWTWVLDGANPSSPLTPSWCPHQRRPNELGAISFYLGLFWYLVGKCNDPIIPFKPKET